MGIPRNVFITEQRVYENPATPTTSPYDVVIQKAYVIRITFAPSLAGQPFTVSAAGFGVSGSNVSGFSFSGIVPAGLVADVAVPQGGMAYVISSGAFNVTAAVQLLFGIYPVFVGSQDLHSLTWQQINDIAASGNAPNLFNIGDEIDAQLTTGEVLTFQIYNFNHDSLPGGGTAAITFGMRDLMAATRRMNATDTNIGSFVGSEMFSWLTTDLWNSFPTDLRDVIKPVNKLTSAGNLSTAINSNTMSVFLFSEVECFGTQHHSFPGEGMQYPIFTDAASRIKRLSNGAIVSSIGTAVAMSWWGRSPSTGDAIGGSGSFAMVTSAGNATRTAASLPNFGGVCFGFCI